MLRVNLIPAGQRSSQRSAVHNAGVLLLALFGIASLLTLSACSRADSASTPSPSPRVAVSVTALPGLGAADRAQDPAAYNAAAKRVINVFLVDGTARRQRVALAGQIAAMPEVVAYHYVTKSEALKRFAATSKRMAELTKNLPVNPFPASFEILVREGVDVASVAQRFYDEPIVFNDPGTHNGVIVGAKSPVPESSPSP
jgi:FtsX extracellular domain